jgi:hypothetical protein
MKATILDAEILSDVIMSEGTPSSWGPLNVTKIGLMNEGKLDGQKWAYLCSMNYSKITSLLPIGSDFIIYLQKKNVTFSIGGYKYAGKSGTNETNIRSLYDPDDIIFVNRLVAYNGSIIQMNILVWSEND